MPKKRGGCCLQQIEAGDLIVGNVAELGVELVAPELVVDAVAMRRVVFERKEVASVINIADLTRMTEVAFEKE